MAYGVRPVTTYSNVVLASAVSPVLVLLFTHTATLYFAFGDAGVQVNVGDAVHDPCATHP